MLEEVKRSLEASPIVKKGDYNYFVNPISDGVPAMDPKMLREISLAVYKHADLDVDKIVAVEAMGIHLATALSLATDIPFVVIRKRQYGLEGEHEVYQKTGYGSSNLYINDLHAGEKILLIDDVVSTGGTLVALIRTLKIWAWTSNLLWQLLKRVKEKKSSKRKQVLTYYPSSSWMLLTAK